MNKNFIVAVAFAGLLASAHSFSQESQICVIKGTPPSDFKFTFIKQLKIGKGSYGSPTSLHSRLSQAAKEVGADAVISYNGSQRFGFWPWRVVRPVVTGNAIVWDKTNPKPFNCVEQGGFLI